MRQALGRPNLSDAACDEFRRQLTVFLKTVLDEYFRDAYGEGTDDLA